MRAEDVAQHEKWECRYRQVLCSLGCGIVVNEHKRVLHEKEECPLRFINCPNGCKETMRFEDLAYHLENDCENRDYTPPKSNWKCQRCTYNNSAKRAEREYGDNVFEWRCAVCKHLYAKKGIKLHEFRQQMYTTF